MEKQMSQAMRIEIFGAEIDYLIKKGNDECEICFNRKSLSTKLCGNNDSINQKVYEWGTEHEDFFALVSEHKKMEDIENSLKSYYQFCISDEYDLDKAICRYRCIDGHLAVLHPLLQDAINRKNYILEKIMQYFESMTYHRLIDIFLVTSSSNHPEETEDDGETLLEKGMKKMTQDEVAKALWVMSITGSFPEEIINQFCKCDVSLLEKLLKPIYSHYLELDERHFKDCYIEKEFMLIAEHAYEFFVKQGDAGPLFARNIIWKKHIKIKYEPRVLDDLWNILDVFDDYYSTGQFIQQRYSEVKPFQSDAIFYSKHFSLFANIDSPSDSIRTMSYSQKLLHMIQDGYKRKCKESGETEKLVLDDSDDRIFITLMMFIHIWKTKWSQIMQPREKLQRN